MGLQKLYYTWEWGCKKEYAAKSISGIFLLSINTIINTI
jgi:hypothetical protein